MGRGDPASFPVPWMRLSKAEWKGGMAWGNPVGFKPRDDTAAEGFVLQGDVPSPSVGHFTFHSLALGRVVTAVVPL